MKSCGNNVRQTTSKPRKDVDADGLQRGRDEVVFILDTDAITHDQHAHPVLSARVRNTPERKPVCDISYC